MIEINTLYVACTSGRENAKFARLSDFQKLGPTVWAARHIDSGGPCYFDARRLFLQLCESSDFSRRYWSVGLPKHWTDNVHTDRMWINKARTAKLDPMAWKFMPNDSKGVLNIDFHDFNGVQVARYRDIPLNHIKPFNH